jgi:hypothetical protein
MIKEFKSGRMYVYKGHSRLNGWNSDGEMDFVLDNKPHLCKKGYGECASFFDCENQNFMWAWKAGFENWFEVTSWKDRFNIPLLGKKKSV